MATKNFVSTQRRDNIYIRKYSIQDLKYAEQLLPNEVQRLYSLSYIDKRYLLINAAIDGFSDIMIYDTKEREVLPLTNDYF